MLLFPDGVFYVETAQQNDSPCPQTQQNNRILVQSASPLELNEMRTVTLGQLQRRGGVLAGLGNLANDLDDRIIVSVSFPLELQRIITYQDSVAQEEPLQLCSSDGFLDAKEGLVVGVDSVQVDSGGGEGYVTPVDASQPNSIDLDGAGDQEDTVPQGLEVHDELSSESTNEDCQDRAGPEDMREDGRQDGLVDLLARR
jgi:hypothetical protein